MRKAVDIKPIRTAADHRAALREIETLMAAPPGSPEADRLDLLATLVDVYEDQHFPVDLPDAVDAINWSNQLPDRPKRTLA